ncbi:MAG: hypothetical protein WB643_10595 [Candidatus Bathyarchaeia archaeon]
MPEGKRVSAVVGHKNRWLAAILSFLVPGVGQWYLRRWKSGAAWFFGSIVLVVFLDALLGALSYFLSVDATGPAVLAIVIGGLVIRIASAWHAKSLVEREGR